MIKKFEIYNPTFLQLSTVYGNESRLNIFEFFEKL
jgi:hypothetical protein